MRSKRSQRINRKSSYEQQTGVPLRLTLSLLQEIKESLDGVEKGLELIAPTRRFVKEGVFTKKSKGKLQQRQYFLFNVSALLFVWFTLPFPVRT